ncbi:hypothetical protein [Duganella qianjiadongensis]|uniref:Uncharacterized protein n=1 Tax=Duganella qianjiadongensis TaxID=2692176 RepID=A0ABW9VDR2_9BURK|nr:hypothetical protein [Duganella qianjiadongensis]MYM37768.1 hypothetical protein [Duganella qianjiadongensis]
MHIKITLAVVLYTVGASMAWALDDTPTLAPRYMPRPDEGRAVSRGSAPLPGAATASPARTVAAENDAVPATVRAAPLRPQTLPLTRVLPAEGHGAPTKLPAKPL